MKPSKKDKLFKAGLVAGVLVSGVSTGVDVQEAKAATPNPASDFTFTVNNGEVTITGYIGAGKTIVFPDTINGMPVVKLGADVSDAEQGSFQNKGITSIVIPNTVKEIGIRAFRGNTIANLTIPSNVQKIGKFAFYEAGIKTITLSEGLKVVDDYAFMNNYDRKTLTLPSTLETVGVSAFSQFGMEGSLTVPKSIKTMGTEAFSRGYLTSVTFEDGLTSIGRWSFMGNELTSVTIPKSVTTIEDHVFSNNRLVNVEIPENIVSFGDGVFAANVGLKEVLYRGRSNTAVFGDWKGVYSFTSPTVFKGYNGTSFETSVKSQGFTFESFVNPSPAKISGIGWSVNSSKTSATISPTIEGDVAKVKYAKGKNLTADYFNDITNKDKIVDISTNLYYQFDVTEGTPYTLYVEGQSGDKSVQTFDPSFAYELDLVSGKRIITGYWGTSKDVTIPSTIGGRPVGSIGSNAFKNLEVTSVNIPNTVKSIGFSAFEGHKMTSLTLPEGVETLDFDAFSGGNLETVSLPSTLKTIGDNAFRSNHLTSVNIPDSVKDIGTYAFSSNGLKTVKLPSGITYLSQGVFHMNLLESINIPNSVTTIDYEAFNSNALKTLVIPDSVTTINDGAFTFNNLETITIPKNLKVIAPKTFAKNDLKEVILPEGVEQIGANAFESNYLTSITIPKSVKTIDKEAFYRNRITTLNISPDSALSTIETKAFSDNPITGINLPNGITKIGDRAFFNSDLSSLYLPKSLVNIGDSAFEGNKNLAVVLFDNSGSETLGTSIFGKPANVVPQFFGNSGNFKNYIEGSYEPSYTVYNSPPKLTVKQSSDTKDIYMLTLLRESLGSGVSTNFTNVRYTISESETLKGDEVFQYAGVIDSPTYDGMYSMQGKPDGNYFLHVRTTTDVKIGSSAPVKVVNDSVTPLVYDTVELEVSASYVVNEAKTSALVKPNINKTNIKSVKYAKGSDLTADFFNNASNAGQITDVTNNANYEFTVTEGLPYTLFVEDNSGNVQVKTFDPSFVYTTMDNTISIQGYWGSEVDVVIPDTIEGLQVTRIAPNAFQPVSESTQLAQGQSTVKLNSVVIPETVTHIGNSAFYKNNLQSITLPQGLTTLEGYAFTGNKLTTVTLPVGITAIADGVFLGNRLTSIDIQGVITQIGADALNGNKLTSFVVPDTVTKIGARALQSNLLSTVTLNDGLISIGSDAFSLNSITNLVIPTTVTKIDARAFNVNPLTYVEFKGADPSVTIGEEAFNTPSAKYYGLQNTIFESYITDKGYSYNNFYALAGYSDQVKKTHSLTITPTVGNPSDGIYYAFSKEENAEDVQSADWVAVPSEGATALLDESFEDGTYYLHTKVAWGTDTLYTTSNPLELDNVPPLEPTLSVAVDESNNKAITVSVDFPTDADKKEYRINGGAWTEYESPITLTENSTIEARAIDTAGNETISSPLVVDVQVIKLKWLLDNYTTATTDDFAWAGVSGITSENINPLKSIVTDYISTFNGGEVTVPTVADYETWLTYIDTLTNIQTSIENAKSIASPSELATAIQDIKDAINALPDWVTGKTSFNEGVSLLERYATALDAVIEAETSLQQEDKTSAQSLVDVIGDAQIEERLTDRLSVVQQFIDATTSVENAESTRLDDDIIAAQDKVTALPEHEVKTELQNRLDALIHLIGVEQAVVKSETTLLQEDKDKAQTLVDTLPDSAEKNSLQNRLDLVQDIIHATNAVVQAELTSSDEDIAVAQEAIDKLPSGEKRTELQNRLDAVKGLNDATKAVVTAETNLTQEDHDKAKQLVDALPDRTEKDDLLSRLDEVQNIINATKAVEDAENSLDKADVDKAQPLVDLIKNETKKDELQDRLDEVSKTITAKDAVETAEGSYSQEDKNKAEQLVDALLPDNPHKQDLIDRLEQIQIVIDAIEAVNTAKETPTEENIKNAQDAINKIDDSNPKKDELQSTLDGVSNLKAVEDAVAKSEATLAQEDVDFARPLVDALADSEVKDAFTERLDEVQRLIDAEKAVSDLEVSLSKDDYDGVKAQVDALKDHPKKIELLDRLEAIKNKIDKLTAEEAAEKAVDTAENTFDRDDYNKAKDLVDKLEEGAKKDELQDRLDELGKLLDKIDEIENALKDAEESKSTDLDDIQNKIDELPDGGKKEELQNKLDEIKENNGAEKAVEKVEETLDRDDYNTAKDLVDKLEDGAKKDELQDRLEDVLEKIEALESVEKAEETNSQTDLDNAKDIVNKLPDSEFKDELLDRLDDLQKELDKQTSETEAEKAVEKVEDSLNKDDYNTAKDLVDNLEDGVKKDELQDRLEDVLDKIDAIEAVENAEKTLTQEDKNDAQSKVDKLPEGELKDELQNRLDEVQNIIDNLSAEEKAEKAVEKVESTLAEGDYNTAKDLVDKLKDGSKKDELQDRLDSVKNLIDLISEIDKLLKEAEDTLNTDKLGDVQSKIDTLPASTIKDSLQDRLDNLLEYKESEKLVTKAEEMKVQSYKDKAQESVNQLKPWKGKDHLQERLDKLQDVIDQKEGDLIDKILNDPDNVTSQELADYTDNDVVDEKLKDYIDTIIEEAENGNITKDDVVQIVRLITFLERAKRSMSEEFISKYEAEYLSATVSVKSKFPVPSVLRAIPSYLNDELDLPSLAQELANMLDRPLDDVLAELEALMGSDVVATLPYTVKYVTEDGEVVVEQSKEAPTGTVVVKAQVPEGYELVSEGSQTFELTEDTKDTVITFVVKPAEEVTTGSYTIEYVTIDNVVVHKETIEGVDFGEIVVSPNVPEGYELLETEEQTQTIELSKDVPFETLRFVVKETVSTETPPTGEGEEVGETPETDEPTTEEPTTEEPTTEEPTTEEPSTEEPTTEEPPVEGNTEEPSDIVVPPTAEEPTTETITAQTVGVESALVRSFLVASLDNAYFTATAQNTGVSHNQYLYDVSQSVVLVKAFLVNPTEETRLEAKNFILANLYAGEFKTLLLKILALAGEEVPSDGEDITIIHPSKPPVDPVDPVDPEKPVDPVDPVDPEKPVDPNPVDPPVVTPPVVKPPVIIPPITGGETTADIEKVHPVEKTEDGYKWVVTNPQKPNYVFETGDIRIELTLDSIKDVKDLEVYWLNKGKGYYDLVIKVNGKTINSLKTPVKIQFKYKHAYLLQVKEGNNKALPHVYKDGKFLFKAKGSSSFYFSPKLITFKDIKYNSNKKVIEELASRHIVFGAEKDLFKPNAKLTQSQFYAMLTRSLGLEVTSEKPHKLLKGAEWYNAEVQALYDVGILSDKDIRAFKPYANLTHKQVVSVLEKAMKQQGINDLDVESSASKGYSKFGRILIKNDKLTLTRSQASKVLYSVLSDAGLM